MRPNLHGYNPGSAALIYLGTICEPEWSPVYIPIPVSHFCHDTHVEGLIVYMSRYHFGIPHLQDGLFLHIPCYLGMTTIWIWVCIFPPTVCKFLLGPQRLTSDVVQDIQGRPG
jgi:hypothetical protein